jgi:hypothetical protein
MQTLWSLSAAHFSFGTIANFSDVTAVKSSLPTAAWQSIHVFAQPSLAYPTAALSSLMRKASLCSLPQRRRSGSMATAPTSTKINTNTFTNTNMRTLLRRRKNMISLTALLVRVRRVESKAAEVANAAKWRIS